MNERPASHALPAAAAPDDAVEPGAKKKRGAGALSRLLRTLKRGKRSEFQG
jgi:hypothetical protein